MSRLFNMSFYLALTCPGLWRRPLSDVAMSDPEADVSKSGSPAPRRSARNTTKEVPKAAKLKRKAREESDEDAMDSGEDHSGSGSDGGSDAEEPVPSRRRAPAEKKTTTAAAAKRQRAADTDDDGFVKPGWFWVAGTRRGAVSNVGL